MKLKRNKICNKHEDSSIYEELISTYFLEPRCCGKKMYCCFGKKYKKTKQGDILLYLCNVCGYKKYDITS